MKHRVIEKAALLTTALILAAATAPAAASACKGLEKPQCEAKSECTWVNGYKRKDGVQVSAYCKGVGRKTGSSTKK